MTDRAYERKKQRIELRNLDRQQRYALKAMHYRPEKKPMETSKWIAILLLSVMLSSLIYTMIVMVAFRDISYIGALITEVIGAAMVYFVYCGKAFLGKKASEDNKLEREKLGLFDDIPDKDDCPPERDIDEGE